MRSSVVDSGRSPGMEEPDSNRAYPTQPRVSSYRQPVPPPQPAQRSSKRQHTFVPEEGWLALLLLAVALYCVVLAIIAAKWVDQSQALLWTPVVGLLVGMGIAKTPRLPQAVLHLAACLLGHWFSVMLTSLAFHTSWLQLLGALRATLGGNIATLTPQMSMMVFFFYLAFLCFFLGYFGSWLVYRARLPWLVALVYGSIMLVNLNYLDTDERHRYLVVVMLGALLLLIARIHLVSQIATWKREGLHTDQNWMHAITSRFMRIATILTLGAMLFSLALPALAQDSGGRTFWNRLDSAWNNLLGGRVSLLNPGSLFQPYEPNTNFFSDQLTISGNVHLPSGEVLNYTSAIGHYLQGFTYNTFDGHTWKVAPGTGLQDQSYAANQELTLDASDGAYRIMRTDVSVVKPPDGSKHYVFAPGQPFKFDVDTVLSSQGDIVLSWSLLQPLAQNKTYAVYSAIPTATPDMLARVPLPRESMELWNEDPHYQQISALDLQLPNDLSPRVMDMARQWTNGATDAYTALHALESRLSDTNVFAYSIDNPPIPRNEDVVDYLLRTRSGYCTHYATAMVMMARYLNIPTRMVNGFSRGHYDAQRKVWSVEGSDAHSWVQAYFPRYGWVDFDPTPGYSLHTAGTTTRPVPAVTPTQAPTKAKPTPTPAQAKATPPPTKPTKESQTRSNSGPSLPINQGLLVGLMLAVVFISLVALLGAFGARWWRNLYANSSFVSGTYWRLCRIASWCGLAPKNWQTPYEYSSMLIRQMPAQRVQPLKHLTELFVRERWGPPQVQIHAQEEADIKRFWPQLRDTLLRRVLQPRRK